KWGIAPAKLQDSRLGKKPELPAESTASRWASSSIRKLAPNAKSRSLRWMLRRLPTIGRSARSENVAGLATEKPDGESSTPDYASSLPWRSHEGQVEFRICQFDPVGK